MGKATQPVSINGLEFDALIDESRTLEATVPEYSVESGFSVSDSVILNPEKLSMTLFVTNTPVTWYRRHGASPTRVDNVVKQLEELYFAKEPVTIVTSDATYTSMAIESITISKSLEIGYARQIPISGSPRPRPPLSPTAMVRAGRRQHPPGRPVHPLVVPAVVPGLGLAPAAEVPGREEAAAPTGTASQASCITLQVPLA